MLGPVVPWEKIRVPHDVDGSRGAYRAPKAMCALEVSNDSQAIGAWLERHEAVETQRAYRREAQRLLLWAIVERGRTLSSLTSEDATAYRAFLRHPAPRTRWVAPACPCSSPEWRPFTGALSPDSIAYALSVLGAMFRWLIEQRYVLANPFAGKVRGASATERWTPRVPLLQESGNWYEPSPTDSNGHMTGRHPPRSACVLCSTSVTQPACGPPS
jgi:hypothetical protein